MTPSDGSNDGRDGAASAGRDGSPDASADGAASAGFDRSPALLSATLSIVAAVLAVGIVAVRFEAMLYLGAAGTVLVAYGALGGIRRHVGHGVVVLLVGITLAGAAGGGPATLIPATLCALLSLDAGRYGIRIGDSVGRAATTERAELVHAALTAAVGAIGVLLGYGAYLAGAGDQPTLAVVLLFVGVVALVVTVDTVELTAR